MTAAAPSAAQINGWRDDDFCGGRNGDDADD